MQAALATIAVSVTSGLLAPAAAAVTPAAYATTAVKLTDGRRVVLRWNPCQMITYRINVSAVPSRQRAAMITQIRAAVTRLTAASGLTYSYEGTTTAVPRTSSIARQSAELIIAVTTPAATDFAIGKGVLGTAATATGSGPPPRPPDARSGVPPSPAPGWSWTRPGCSR